MAAATWSQKNKLASVPPGLPGMNSSVVSSEGLSSPITPSEEMRPLTAPLNLDYSTKVCEIIRN